ncbi:hypothetical protein GUJ93_ZPchr0028g29053 [Zizania palustris]|uniref:Uncharacterized protein n=1 Tax=Zizania palustris TaxID=103762 RepID=A0A8J5R5G1_ZIZPA|nr:hypothetical protein GUJ93_ZPchr0028g29053 [Zizania palustris]
MAAWADAALLLGASPSPAAASSSPRCLARQARVPVDSRTFRRSFPCTSRSKAGFHINSCRARSLKVKAKMDSDDGKTQLAPLIFESPSGQLLVQILQSYPHLLPATVDRQLENLQSEKDAQEKEAARTPQDLLYKRIAEVKERKGRTPWKRLSTAGLCISSWRMTYQ